MGLNAHAASIGFVLFIRKPLSNSALLLLFFFFFLPFLSSFQLAACDATSRPFPVRLRAASSGRRAGAGHGFPGQKAIQRGSERGLAALLGQMLHGKILQLQSEGRRASRELRQQPWGLLHRAHRMPKVPGDARRGTELLGPLCAQNHSRRSRRSSSSSSALLASELQLMCFSLQALQAL